MSNPEFHFAVIRLVSFNFKHFLSLSFTSVSLKHLMIIDQVFSNFFLSLGASDIFMTSDNIVTAEQKNILLFSLHFT